MSVEGAKLLEELAKQGKIRIPNGFKTFDLVFLEGVWQPQNDELVKAAQKLNDASIVLTTQTGWETPGNYEKTEINGLQPKKIKGELKKVSSELIGRNVGKENPKGKPQYLTGVIYETIPQDQILFLYATRVLGPQIDPDLLINLFKGDLIDSSPDSKLIKKCGSPAIIMPSETPYSSQLKDIASMTRGVYKSAQERGLGAECLILEGKIINDPIEKAPKALFTACYK